MDKRILPAVRRALIAASVACVVAVWVLEPKGEAGVLVSVLFALTGIPAAVLTLYLMAGKRRDR